MNFWKDILLVCLILCLGCMSETGVEKPTPDQASFFALKSFMENETKTLTMKRAVKRVSFNDEVEEQEIDTSAVRTDLSIFSSFDLNKPAWNEKYEVDSVFNGNQLQRVVYSALDNKLKTRKQTVEFGVSGTVSRIFIENETNNIIYKGKQELEYNPGLSYRILTQQDVIFSSPNTSNIEVSLK